jgi:iron complex outermembrane receptor protein
MKRMERRTSATMIAAGRVSLAIGLAVGLPAVAIAQVANEDHSAADPAPAEQAVAAQAGVANQPGTGNPPAAASQGDEIVVTAQFRSQNLQDTPIAITAMSSAMLESRSQTNISQVANQAPSVTLKPQGSAFGPSLGANIRGVGQFDFNPAVEPGVGFYVDDVYFATLTGSILDLLDLDRVEILRGPQGTLAGRNSIGGAIKLYSKRPTGDGTGYVAGAYGSRNRIDLRGSADFNLAEGIDVRLSGVAKKQEGYVKRLDFGCVYPAGGSATLPANAPLNPGTLINPAGGVPAITSGGNCLLAKEGQVNYIAGRAQVRLRPTDKFEFNIIGDYTDDDRATAPNLLLERFYPNGALASPRFPLPAIPPYATATALGRDIQPFATTVPYDTRFVCGKYCTYENFINPADGTVPAGQGNGRIRFRGWGVSGQAEWELADRLQLVSISAYRGYKSEFSNDNDASPLAHSLGYGPLTFRFFSQEVRLNGSFGSDKQIQYTIGGYYSDQKSVYTSFQDLRVSALRFAQKDPVAADSKAVFAQAAWTPVERLTLNGGIRYTDESKSYTYVRVSPEGGVAPAAVAGLNGLIGKYSGDHIDYRGNVQYKFTDNVMAYAQVSTGFKGGGVNPRPYFAQQVLPFGQEKLTSYEIGAKTDLFDRRVRVNVAAFISKYDGIQLALSNCTAIAGQGFGVPCGLPVNAGDADIKGIEVETTLRPIEGLVIDSSASFLDFKYKRFGNYTSTNPATGAVTNVSVGGPNNINGPQFGDYAPYTPRWKWSVGAQYEIDLDKAGSLTPRVDASYQGQIYTNTVNRSSNRINGYTVANARLTWRNSGGDLEISGEVTNVFDKYYLLTIYDQTVGAQGFATGQPGRPREWALNVKKKF